MLRKMKYSMRRDPFIALPLLFVLMAGGCSWSPEARKQKSFAQGDRDFNRARYPEAIISFARALQLDPSYTEAHFKLAQCHLRQGNWTLAYQELMRTIELQPDNWAAQLDLGRLLLAGGKAQEAKNRALLILHRNASNVEAQVLLSNADARLGNLKAALQEAKDAV